MKTQHPSRGTDPSRQHPLLESLNQQNQNHVRPSQNERAWPAGTHLFTAGDRATSVYAITSGSVKIVRTTPDGRQRIVRLLRENDIAGIEALAGDAYDNDAVTMTEVTGHRLSASALHTASTQSQDVYDSLMRKWHRALRSADSWLADFNVGPAGTRVRHFLLGMRSATDPTLTTIFSREDMGAMMGLKLETVSRELTALVRAGLIQRIDTLGRAYRIMDAERLARPAG